MAEFIFFMVLVLPATLGFAEILHILKRWLFSSGKKGERILFLIPDNENFERQILELSNEYMWQGNILAEKIFIINTRIDYENRKECDVLARKSGFKVLEQENFNISDI